MEKVLEYISYWNGKQPKHKGIRMLPLCDNYDLDDIYEIHVRFPGTAYKCTDEDFENLKGALTRRSSGALRVSSSLQDFRGGILSINVAFCNNAYRPIKVMSALKMLTEEIFPDLKK